MKDAVLTLLDTLDITYTLTEHEAAFTVEQADVLYGHLEGAHAKNLFLRNKKGNRHYLAVVESHTPVNLKALRAELEESTLSFASPERLLTHLGLTPGSVSPFGLINNTERTVQVVLDAALRGYETVNFHPNINTATLSLARADFERFLDHCGHERRWVDFTAARFSKAIVSGDGASKDDASGESPS